MRTKRSGLKVLAVGLLIVSPTLYPVSIGPAGQCMERKVWFKVYRPIIWLADRSPPVATVIRWYTNSFGVDHYDGRII
jgi:hypothetical protein